MSKSELVDELASSCHLTKEASEAVVTTTFESITEALAKGERVELRGFGTFAIRQRRGRIGRNPKTGVSVSVPAKRVPFFKMGKRLRALVNA